LSEGSIAGNNASAGNAQLQTLLCERQQSIYGHALDAGHRRHRLRRVRAVEHEHGVNQIIAGVSDVRVLDGREKIVAAQSTHAALRVLTKGIHIFHLPKAARV
jgi:hypothetical protein